MSWEKSSYTAAGAALLSESLSGGALVITRAVSGTGTADADLSGETGVSGETHDLKLLDIETVESGAMTKDLAILIGPDQAWMTTEQFFEAVRVNLENKMATWA